MTKVFVANRGDAFRLTVTASDGLDMSTAIFLHQQTPADPHTGETGEDFIAIASAYDLTIYPIEEPDAAIYPPFYRKAAIDIILPSLAVALEVWNAIEQEVEELATALDKLDVLGPDVTVRCGAESED
jgi:hypothetical protein